MGLLHARLAKYDLPQKMMEKGIYPYFRQITSKQGTEVTMDGKHILIEMSYYERSREIRDEIFNLQMDGYQPVLAHPERYVFYQKAWDKKKGVPELKEFIEAGCQLQLNVMSLTGAYGEGSMAILHWLLDNDMYSFIGTDVHARRQIDHFNGLQITAAQLDKVRQLARNNETLFD